MSESDEEYEEATPEQKLNIATYFLSCSPTGEIDEVIKDVKALVGDDILTPAALDKILCNYNVEQMTSATDPDGKGLLVAANGKVSQDEFLDPSTGRVLKFDHKERKFTEVTDRKQVLKDEVKLYRDKIDDALKGYIDSVYKTDKCVGAVFGDDEGNITICLSAKNVHLGSFWTGGWRSVFTLNVANKGEAKFSGTVKTNVHYFESGNVQLHTNKDVSLKITVADAPKTALDIAKAISEAETAFQTSLEEMYVNMPRSTFKSMRRFYPVTGQTFQWNIAAHSVSNQVTR